MPQRYTRKITFDLPITISLHPHPDWGRESAWEIIDGLNEKDIENALLAVFDQYSDGREPISVELVRRELQSLVTDAIWLVLKRRMREKYPSHTSHRTTGAAEVKLKHVTHYTTFASVNDAAERRGVDSLGNVLDGPW